MSKKTHNAKSGAKAEGLDAHKACQKAVGLPPTGRKDCVLWYRKPAGAWVEALAIGNGRLGAMVFGGTAAERLALNEDTLWSGGPREWNNPQAREVLPEVRRLIAEGQWAEAHQSAKKMMGPFSQSYMPLGDLHLEFAGHEAAEGYRRELDLATAVASVQYTVGGVTYERQAFCSHPDGVLVVHLTASRAGSIDFTARLSSQLQCSTRAEDGALVLAGRAPAHVDHDPKTPVNYSGDGMTFECRLQALAEGGTAAVSDGELRVKGATAVTLLMSAATSFNGYDKSPAGAGKDPAQAAGRTLAAAAGKTFESLRAAHVADHQRLFNRMELSLGDASPEAAAMATDERLIQFGASDAGLVALYFQFGRYLMIAGSRPLTQPTNLQGIWNDALRPPWNSNYTLNINAEMNYWPAELCNLSECHEPLFSLIADLAVTGHKTAEVNYGCGGWVAHHNTDLWRQSAPVGDWGAGDPVYATWPMAGPWLCQHLWQRYEFSGDEAFLRDRAYPLMKGAAEFCLDFLIDDGQGRLVTSPSTSPENGFVTADGQRSAVSMGSTMDMAMIWDLFSNCISAAGRLGVDEAFARRLAEAKAKLLPPRVGGDGRLQEWFRDDLQDRETHHRHVSHLWGLYPGRQINGRETPELLAGARRSLEVRGDDGTGWSLAWKINLWARLGDGERVHKLLLRLLEPCVDQETNYFHGGTYGNLFDSHPPFQIDGNFGAAAGIAEMLLQSRCGEIVLLPALPKAWASGRVRGLRARGGFEVDIEWRGGRLVGATVRAIAPAAKGRCSIRYGDQVAAFDALSGGQYIFDGRLVLLE